MWVNQTETEKQVPRDVKAGAAPANEWLDTLISRVLYLSFGRAEPRPVTWVWIRQRIQQSQRRPQQGEAHHGTKSVEQDIGRFEMFGWSHVLAEQERCEDLRREADRYRRVQQALAGRQGHHHFRCRAMNWLGRWLVAWGWRLQERYGAPAAAPALQASHYARMSR
jgi:hypothetical protein